MSAAYRINHLANRYSSIYRAFHHWRRSQ